jgi:hypothetical protein
MAMHQPLLSAETAPRHLTADELAGGLAAIILSPKDRGTLEMIVVRPSEGERRQLTRGELTPQDGLLGDRWRRASWLKLADDSPDPAVQITLMNARAIALIAGEPDFWPLAGDNLFVDLDLSRENLPVGTRLIIGDAVLEIAQPAHNGCHKFKHRFGQAAVKFVNSAEGKALRLRGVHARVIQAGDVTAGDSIRVERPA